MEEEGGISCQEYNHDYTLVSVDAIHNNTVQIPLIEAPNTTVYNTMVRPLQ
jgi:hypothetical protein